MLLRESNSFLYRMIEVHNGNNSSNRYRGYLVLLQNQAILWRLAESPLAGGKISVPFQLTFPRTNNLPPSFHSSGRHWSGTVQYYVKVVGVRTGMFRRNFRIIVNLPYLPLSSRAFPPQTLDLPTWKGQWGTFKNVEQMRRGLWGGHGRVETEVSRFRIMLPTRLTRISQLWTPFIDRIPLFRPFPIQLRVATYSKLLPHSASHNPSTYEFPLFTPAPTSVSVSLVLQVNVVAQALFSRPLRKSVGPGESVGHLIGGFGVKPGDTAWAKDVIMDSSQSNATWTVLPDDKSGDSGRWKTDTVFQSVVTFHDPPTWATDILSWEVGNNADRTLFLLLTTNRSTLSRL
jgi:hypothetical protein